MAQSSYLKNAILLTGTGLLLRAVGMGFRVFIAGCLSSEGMGLHQLIFSIYNVSIALATSGVSVAATRLAAAAANHAKASAAARRVFGFGVAAGLLAGAIQFLLAGPAARLLLGDARAALPLQVLAPSLPFMALAAALRGYFLGRRNIHPNIRAQLVEQAVRIALVYGLLLRYAQKPIGVLCVCVVAGNTVSEIISCCIMLLYWKKEQQKEIRLPHTERKCLDREIVGILLPIEGSRGLSSALHAAESALVPACLTLYLGDRVQAISQFGALRGMAMPLLFFPFSFLATLSTLLLPEITQAHTEKRIDKLERLIGKMMLLTGGLSVLAGGLCTMYGRSIAQLLYHDGEVGTYLCMLGPVMPLMYLESMVDGVLKGMGEQLATFRYSLLDSVLRIAGTILLLPRFGIRGFIGLMIASNFLTCLLNTLRMLAVAGIRADWLRWLVRPALLLIFSLLAGQLLQTLAAPPTATLQLLAGAGGTAICYFCLWWPCGLGAELVGIRQKQNKKAAFNEINH